MINTVEAEKTEKLNFGDAKLSDWIEQQPLSRFCPYRVRQGEKMCAWGMVADFYGQDWSTQNSWSLFDIYPLIMEHWGMGTDWPIIPNEYDSIYVNQGPQAAKDYAVDALRRRGI